MVHSQHKDPPRIVHERRIKSYAWHYLTSHGRVRPIHYVDPEVDLKRHADDLPEDWRESPYTRRGDDHISALGRAAALLAEAQQLQTRAFTLAGFHPTEAAYEETGNASRAPRAAYDMLTNRWEYRRFGFRIVQGTQWIAAGFPPHRARVYADAGIAAYTANLLEQWADKQMRKYPHLARDLQFPRQRLAIAVLDHDNVARARIVNYLRAGIRHHEIPEWEARRTDGEPIDDTVATLIALKGGA